MTDDLKALATILRHRDQLRLGLYRLTKELDRRALEHDLTKFELDELEGFVRINQAAREHEYESIEYRNSMQREKREGGCIALHFSRNSHHPEYHSGVRSMGWLDIIEMVLDWDAAAETYRTTSFRDGLKHHRKRFDFSDAQWWLIEQVAEWVEAGRTP